MTGTQTPNIRNGSLDGGSIIISHKEFLGNVTTFIEPNRFAVSTYRINPGDSKTFPWLSQIARNFQQYRLRGCCFHFKSMSGDAITGTNTALGSVIMSTNYDATQPDPLTKSELENLEFAQSTKPSKNMVHFIECAKSQSPVTQLYVNESPDKQEGDVRFYDFGKFHLATDGMQGASVVIGELWISYEIQLYKPQLWDAMGKDVDFFAYRGSVTKTGVAPSRPLGNVNWKTPPDGTEGLFAPNNNMVVNAWNPLGVVFEPTGVPKCYVFYFYYSNTVATAYSIFTNFQRINCEECDEIYGTATDGVAQGQHAPADDQTGTRRIQMLTTRITQANCDKIWGFQWNPTSAIPASVNAMEIVIQEMPYVDHTQENRGV